MRIPRFVSQWMVAQERPSDAPLAEAAGPTQVARDLRVAKGLRMHRDNTRLKMEELLRRRDLRMAD